MKFRTWWMENRPKIEKAANFWLLPGKWKRILNTIIKAVDELLSQDPTAFSGVDTSNLS